MSAKPHVDWEPLRQYGCSTITCRCGAVYRSLCKAKQHEGRFVMVTETACPGCGAEFGHVFKAASDPEYMVIGGKKS